MNFQETHKVYLNNFSIALKVITPI